MYGNMKLVILFSCCIHLVTTASFSDELLQYTISVIQHYDQQKPGWFKCTFYDLSAGTDNGWFGKLISSAQLDRVAKYVLNEHFHMDFGGSLPFKQDLLVIFVGDRIIGSPKCPILVEIFFTLLHTNSPLMVLLNIERFDVYRSIMDLLANLQFDKVTFIGMKHKAIIQMGLFGEPEKMMAQFPYPKELIRSNIRNSYGRPIRITYVTEPWYPARLWVYQMALFLNTSLQYHRVCTTATMPLKCMEMLYRATYIDISLDQRGTEKSTSSMIFGVTPTSRVILVPQGRLLNAMEIFTKPFAWETWFVILLMLISIAVINLTFTSLFENEPILLVVCGYGKLIFHRANTKEKFALLPMIVFFFLVFNAYGTKLISFMTNKPSIGNIKTLDELAKSGIKITADLYLDRCLANDSLLGPLMVHKPIGPDNVDLDGENAHLSNDLEASTVVSLRRNYDFKLNRPKYAIINERKSTTYLFYWVGIISPLAEMFYYTQKMFFESGLFNLWQKEVIDIHVTDDRYDHMRNEVDDPGMLSFEDMVPTWMVLTIGLLVSLVGFGLEVLRHSIQRINLRVLMRLTCELLRGNMIKWIKNLKLSKLGFRMKCPYLRSNR